MKYRFLFILIALFFVSSLIEVNARAFPRGSYGSSAPVFNGKLVQTNPNVMQNGGGYQFLNSLKSAAAWGFNNNADAAVTPDLFDANGYFKSTSSQGVATVWNIPSPQEYPGNQIITWTGDGIVQSFGANASLLAYTISSITQTSGVQTVNLSSAPTEMVAGQPIEIANITSGGTWTNFNNTWKVQDVNTSCSNCFRINTGATYTSTPTGGLARFTSSTIVANPAPGTLNGSGRNAYVMNQTIGGADGVQFGIAIVSVNSAVNYPHDIKVFNINDEVLLNAGQIYSTRFLSYLSNFGVVRFLNWQAYQSGNFTNQSSWYTRKPSTYAYWNGHEYRPDLYGGAASLSGSTFTVSAPTINSSTGAAWAGLLDKSTVHVNFTNTGRAAATIASGTIAFN